MKAPEGPAGRTRAGVEPLEAVPQVAQPQITLTVNGEVRCVQVDVRMTLLDMLREELGLTGAKKGCDRGECGTCTVLLGGKPIYSCMTLAIMNDCAEVTTVEGIAGRGELHPLQQAFVSRDALQCGFCTPGQILSAIGVLAEAKATSAAEVRQLMSGNLCRCGAYPNIVDAILDVVGKSDQ